MTTLSVHSKGENPVKVMKRSRLGMGLAAMSVLLATACGSSDKAPSSEATAPAATEAAAGTEGPTVTEAITAITEAVTGGEEIGVSLILKNTSNPFFVSMAADAQKEADASGIKLTVAAGKEDGDVDTQIAAIEAAIANGDKGILITPSADDVVPALQKAREAGLLVIALDTPPGVPDSVDITFATDNYLAGQLIGKWAAGQLAGKKATIAMLDLFNDKVVRVDTARDQGFLNGMGIVAKEDLSGNGNEPKTGSYSGGDYEVVCHEPTNGAADGGKTAMETCLAANPDVNVVYTINEPAAQGAYDALKAAGKETGVIIVSVDGGCSPGLELVASGVIGATAQQYPGKMASLGMQAIKKLAEGGAKPSVSTGLDFFNTGVALVTDTKVAGVDSISVADGQKSCWGGTAAPASSGEEIGVSLILKNTSNPFFVSMAADAQKEADASGIKLTVAAGKEDGDVDTQIAAIEAAIANGDKGILITPSADDVVPALQKAREAGLLVIALDTPPGVPDSVDITFATDNYLAGQLIGKWAAGQLAGKKATIAMLDLFNDKVVRVDTARDQGFLNGMGIVAKEDLSGNGNEPKTGSYSGGDYEVVCHEPTNGAADGGKTAMETCLAANPDVNVVYTINEPAAQGAYDALKAAGKETGVIIVSVDGGCSPGLELVASGVIGATAQQYPGKMASLGMQAIKKLAEGGAKPSVSTGLDFFNTGVALVTDTKVAGVDSISVADGQKSCWGGTA